MMRRKLLNAAMASALVLLTVQAWADVVKHNFRRDNFIFDGPEVLVPLNEAGATSITFSGSGRFTISYTAECAVAGTAGAWMDIRIIVDGVNLGPTGDNSLDAFCTSNGTDGFDGWTMDAAWGRTGNLTAGNHTVEVRARTSDDASDGWLGDSSLVIIK